MGQPDGYLASWGIWMFTINSGHRTGKLLRAVGGAAVTALLITGLVGCNTDSGSDDSGSGENCGYQIAFFGALTGSAAGLGINIAQGAELAVDQYNAKTSANCVTLAKFDSQGSPDVAPGLARQLVTNAKILGIVGPAFSGESEAANPIFNEAGVPLITPSATRTSLATKGWTVFHRAVANDDAQGPAAAGYIKNALKATKVFVADDQSAYGAGLANIVKERLGGDVVGTDNTAADGMPT